MSARVQQIYIALFGRPADPLGEQFWDNLTNNGANLAPMLAALTPLPEYQDRFAGLSTAQQVNSIYQSLFGRDADLTGLTFFVNAINNGSLTLATLAVNILDGAQGTDKEIIENKVASAQNFTASLDTTAEILAYTGDAGIAAGTSFLNGISSDDSSVKTTAQAETAITSLVQQGSQVNGKTVTLTTNIDAGPSFAGTAQNDKFIGTVGAGATSTVQAADQVDGGLGTDRLEIYSDGAAVVLPSITSVEDLYIKGALTNLDFSAVSSLKTIEVDGAATADSATESAVTLAAGQTLTLDSITDGDTAVDTDGNGELEVNTASSVTSVSLVLDGVGADTSATHDLDIEVLGSGVSAINLAATGAASFISLGVNAASALETLTITGDKNLTVTNQIDFATGKGATVNASAASGNLSLDLSDGEKVTFTGGSGKNTVVAGAADDTLTGGAKADTFTTGAGNDTVSTLAGDDTIVVAANLTKDDKIDGGEGTDTLSTTESTINADDKAAAAGVTNVEVFGTTTIGDVTVDFKALEKFNSVAILGAATNANVAATMENDDLLIVRAARDEDADAALNITPSLDGGANTASLKIVGNSDITGKQQGIVASTIETLNVEIVGTLETGSADTVTIGDVDAGDNDNTVGTNAKIVLTSSLEGAAKVHNNVDLGIVKGTNVTIDGSAFKGNIVATGVDGNVTLMGGEGADTLTGGAGTDSISGGLGKDILTGGQGADVIALGGGRDALSVTVTLDATAGPFSESSEAAMDKVSGFNVLTADIVAKDLDTIAEFQASSEGGAEADLLSFVLLADDAAGTAGTAVANAIEANGTASGIQGSITGAVGAVDANVKDGILTLSGAGAASVDTLAEWVDAAQAVAATAGETLAFEFNGNTYVYAENGAQDGLVELTGLTGVTGVGLADASTDAKAGWILIG